MSFKKSSSVESEEDSKRPLIESSPDIKTYARRWWVLGVFSAACFLQNIVWNTYGPITESAEAVFGWTDGMLGMLPNYANIAYVVVVMPVCVFMDVKGLRFSILLAMFLILIGTGLRCITSSPTLATWFAYICCVLNGIAGVVVFAGPALVSATWFPPNQRATATSISTFFMYFGLAISFVIGPQLVSSPQYAGNGTVNSSEHEIGSFGFYGNSTNHNRSEVTNLKQVESEIMHLMYIECGFAALVFLAALLYFPAKPPTPPSVSASINRVDYADGLKKLVCSGRVWLISLAFSLPVGVSGVWSAVLDVNLKAVNISQDIAGWIGFYATIAGCFAGLFVARFSDIFMRHMKKTLLLMMVLAVASMAWFTLLYLDVIPYSLVWFYIACVATIAFINGSIPLLYELACEASYPVAEGVTGGFVTLITNVVGISFLFVLLIPDIGKDWMNWTLLGSLAVTLPLLLIFPEHYGRTNLDITIDVSAPNAPIQSSSDIVSVPIKHTHNIANQYYKSIEDSKDSIESTQ